MLMGLKLGLKGYFKEITSNNPTKKQQFAMENCNC